MYIKTPNNTDLSYMCDMDREIELLVDKNDIFNETYVSFLKF